MARYKVVRVKAESQSLDRLLYCKACKQPLAGPTRASLMVSHRAPLSPPMLCRRRGPSTCAGIGPIRPRLAAIGTSANSSTGSHDLPRSSRAVGRSTGQDGQHRFSRRSSG